MSRRPAAEGFLPLRKAMSEPVHAPTSHLGRSAAYSGPDPIAARLGAGARMELDALKKEWKPVRKMASFTKHHKGGESSEEVEATERENAAAQDTTTTTTSRGDGGDGSTASRSWFSFSPKKTTTPRPRAVVVVDPFSTGALLATRAVDLGYRVVRVLSSDDSPVASLVAAGVCVDYEATVTLRGETVDAYDAGAAALKALPYELVALLPGAETGVLAADELAARLGLRSNINDATLSRARRNKYLQGEIVRAAGARAVGQHLATCYDHHLDKFLDTFLGATSNDGAERGPHKTPRHKALDDVVESESSSSSSFSSSRSSSSSSLKLETTSITLENFPRFVVVKPVESAGSDDVFKCGTRDQVKKAVERIAGKINGLGARNEAALVQEYLLGDEYVVDSVSKDGEHKVLAIWLYDKRAANGSNFCYHAMSLVDATGPSCKEERRVAAELAEYAGKVLDALGIVNGPSHLEVKYDSSRNNTDGDRCCLVEVGARCHGGEGSWSPIAKSCRADGLDQIDATLIAYLEEDASNAFAFKKIPSRPPPLCKFGAEVFFVNRRAGMVRSVEKATKYVQSLPSFFKLDWQLAEGDFAPLTVDCFTRPGSAQLVHADRDVLWRDVAAIRALERGPCVVPLSSSSSSTTLATTTTTTTTRVPPLLDLDFACATPVPKGAVVVVDPYSTGAILASRVRTKHRKLLVVVHSDADSPVAALVAADADVRPHATVAHVGAADSIVGSTTPDMMASSSCLEEGSNDDDQVQKNVLVVKGAEATAAKCAELAKGCVVATIPGAETGVLLADALAAALGTRVNPARLSRARRNKYLQGEAVRAAGVRAVRQCRAATRQDAERFLQELRRESLEEENAKKKTVDPPQKASPLTQHEPVQMPVQITDDGVAVRGADSETASIFPLVVKPIESAGSDDVFKCRSEIEVIRAVERIAGKVNGLGCVNEGALVQEFLRGDEYVVDSVSRDGVHKVVAVWLYDKRSVNGANFVYHGMGPVDFHAALADSSEGGESSSKKGVSSVHAAIARDLATYAKSVLDALEIFDGPSHMEIKYDHIKRSPCLVEVGARCHGGEGTWLPIADACVGYNQVDAALASYLDAAEFEDLPDLPPPFKAHGREVFLVSHHEGRVHRANAEKVTALPSFAKMELAVQPGSTLSKTVDCFTRPGAIQLIHHDPDVVERDFHTIHRLMEQGDLFTLVADS